MTGINDLGVVTGDGGDDLDKWSFSGFHADERHVYPLRVPGALLTVPLSINNRNDLPGLLLDSDARLGNG